MKNNQKGFGALEGLLVLVIVGLLGFVGWYVWHSKNNVNKTFSTAASTSAAASPAKKTTQQTTNTNPSYLVITEWGLRVQLTSAIEDAYYKVLGNSVDLSLKSLENTQCKAGGWPPSHYDRYTSTDI